MAEKLEKCVGCGRVKVGNTWYYEGTITAVETTVHKDTYCPQCSRRRKDDQGVGSPIDTPDNQPE